MALLNSDSLNSNIICAPTNKQIEEIMKNLPPSKVWNKSCNNFHIPSVPKQNPTKLAIIIIQILITAPIPHKYLYHQFLLYFENINVARISGIKKLPLTTPTLIISIQYHAK